MNKDQHDLLVARRNWSNGMDAELERIIALLLRAEEQWAGYPPASVRGARELVRNARDQLREVMVLDGYDVETGEWLDWGNGGGI
jgi:hypothetical protein